MQPSLYFDLQKPFLPPSIQETDAEEGNVHLRHLIWIYGTFVKGLSYMTMSYMLCMITYSITCSLLSLRM